MIRAKDPAAGFTLYELMITVAVVGILSGVALANYSQRWGEQQLLTRSRSLHAWLDQQRRIAMQQGGTCEISLHAELGTLSADNEEIEIPDGQLPNVCYGQAPFNANQQSNAGVTTVITHTPEDVQSLLFSFRGFSKTSQAISDEVTDNPTAAFHNASTLELRLSQSSLTQQRCLKVLHPLGLIREGRAPNATQDCIYNSAY